jgi:hypothetical protein
MSKKLPMIDGATLQLTHFLCTPSTLFASRCRGDRRVLQMATAYTILVASLGNTTTRASIYSIAVTIYCVHICLSAYEAAEYRVCLA